MLIYYYIVYSFQRLTRGRRTYTAQTVNSVPFRKKEWIFRPTYVIKFIPKSKLNTELFKMRILPPKCTILQICTYIFTNFPRVALLDPHNWEGQAPSF